MTRPKMKGYWAFDFGPIEPLAKYFQPTIKIEIPRADRIWPSPLALSPLAKPFQRKDPCALMGCPVFLLGSRKKPHEMGDWVNK